MNDAARAIMTPAERQHADELEIDMRIQNIQSEAHELSLVTEQLSDEQLERLMRATLVLSEMGMNLTNRVSAEPPADWDGDPSAWEEDGTPASPPHDHAVHPAADGADGRDSHAS